VPLVAPATMILLLIIFMFFANQNFFNAGNIRAIWLDASIILVLGVGMTIVITARGIDLSIGAILVLSSVVMSAAIKDFGLPPLIGMALALLTGMLCGLINGLLVTKLRMPDFIVTLSTELVFRGLALIYAGGAIFFGFPEIIRFLGTGRVLDIPMPIVIGVVIAIIGHAFLAWHRFGLRLHAVGGNPTAARRLGVKVDRYRIGSYVIMGFLAAVGGLVLAGRLDAVVASGAVTLLLNTIAAVIVGGTDLFGGRGSIIGTMLGAVLLAMIANAVVLLGLEAFWQHVAAGLVILITIALHSRRTTVVQL
jgi:ribose/xylose/arabinose/galactoside ABC-type transport system permease subunit